MKLGMALILAAMLSFAGIAAAGCTDSDSGMSIYLQGMVIAPSAGAAGVTATDFCMNSTTLVEYFCANGSIGDTTINCNCQNGACIPAANCNETDAGIDQYLQGTVTVPLAGAPGASATDFCINSTTLVEYFCANGTIGNTTMSCDCLNGACIPAANCNETDGGIDQYLQGTVTVQLAGAPGTSATDFCMNSTTLVEYFCANGTIGNTTMSCDCLNGACIVAANCTDTDSGIDQYLQGTVTSPSTGAGGTTATDFCINSTTLVEYFCANGSIGDMMVSCDCQNGACINQSVVVPKTNDSDISPLQEANVTNTSVSPAAGALPPHPSKSIATAISDAINSFISGILKLFGLGG